MSQSQEKYDVIIVGAGPNGLTAGAYLAKTGARVLIVEKSHETGGGLVTEDFSGFRFNLHATYMLLADWMPAVKDLELGSQGCAFVQPEVPISLLTKDGNALTLYRDIERSAKSIERFSPRDADRYRVIMQEWEQMTNEALIPPTYTPPAMPLDLLMMYQKSELGRKVLEITEKTPVEIIDECGFENEYLKTALLYLATMWGLDPNGTGLGFLVPLIINRMLNAGLVRGGSHSLSSVLQRAFVASGGTIAEESEVVKVLMDSGAATGVELADGRKFYGRAVMTTTNPQATFLELVGEEACREISPALSEAAKEWAWDSTSYLGVHLALSEAPRYSAADADPAVNDAMLHVMGIESVADLVAHIEAVKQGNVEPIGHATTTTAIDPIQGPFDLFPENAVARWESKVPFELNHGSWDDMAEATADRILEQWKQYAPNLENARLIRRYVYPPSYIEAKLPTMVRGSIKHGDYIPTQMGSFRPNIDCSAYRTPIENFYMCGASTYPGAMVLLANGYNAAGVVAEDLDLDRWWKEPGFVTEAREKGFVK